MIVGALECLRLMQAFQGEQDLRLGRQIHLVLFKTGLLLSSLYWTNRLLQIYSRHGGCDELCDARRLFDDMPLKNCFSWNTLIDACFNSGKTEISLRLFDRMPLKNPFSWNLMIAGLAKKGDVVSARKLFEEMPIKEALPCNCVMHGYIRHGSPKEALKLFKRMNAVTESSSVWNNDKHLMATALSACAHDLSYDRGRQIHAQILVGKIELDSALSSSLVDMYGKCGDLDHALHSIETMPESDEFSLSSLLLAYAENGRLSEARRLFHEKENPNAVLWNSLLTAYLSNGEAAETLELCKAMVRSGVAADSSSLTTVLSACASTSNLRTGEQFHGRIIRSGQIADVAVGTALVDLYAKAGSLDRACRVFVEAKHRDTILLNSMITAYSNFGRIQEARKLFGTIENRTLISWNSMLVGYSKNGLAAECLELLAEMHRSGLKLDKVSIASGISACAGVSSLRYGEHLFALAETLGLRSNSVISTSLIDLYCKCGNAREAQIIFDSLGRRDEAAWNSMLMGYASNGCGSETLDLFESMKRAGLNPNGISNLAVLTGCCHCGLVAEGERRFLEMQEHYKISPMPEHYSCIVDLLVRAGKLGEALGFIDAMPFEPDETIWASLLRGCQDQGDELLGKKVAERLMAIDPNRPGVYVQLSTIYAGQGMWDRSLHLRRLLQQKVIVKNPGISWLDR